MNHKWHAYDNESTGCTKYGPSSTDPAGRLAIHDICSGTTEQENHPAAQISAKHNTFSQMAPYMSWIFVVLVGIDPGVSLLGGEIHPRMRGKEMIVHISTLNIYPSKFHLMQHKNKHVFQPSEAPVYPKQTACRRLDGWSTTAGRWNGQNCSPNRFACWQRTRSQVRRYIHSTDLKADLKLPPLSLSPLPSISPSPSLFPSHPPSLSLSLSSRPSISLSHTLSIILSSLRQKRTDVSDHPSAPSPPSSPSPTPFVSPSLNPFMTVLNHSTPVQRPARTPKHGHPRRAGHPRISRSSGSAALFTRPLCICAVLYTLPITIVRGPWPVNAFWRFLNWLKTTERLWHVERSARSTASRRITRPLFPREKSHLSISVKTFSRYTGISFQSDRAAAYP